MTLCIALLVERKLINYDDLIMKHWPDFGDNDKANITIGMLLSHVVRYRHYPFFPTLLKC